MHEDFRCFNTTVSLIPILSGGQILGVNWRSGSMVQSLDKALNIKRLKCLGYGLYNPAEGLPSCTLSSKADDGWKVDQGDQSLAWQKCMKTLMSRITP